MVRAFFDRFEALIRCQGTAAVGTGGSILATEARFYLRYTPFEHVNADARLVIVGITPGPNQLLLAYAEVQRLLRLATPREAIFKMVKRVAGFGGSAMRPNLLRMLRHFRFGELLGIDNEEELWGSRSDLLHSTSVVPHAAFLRNGRPYAGSFGQILASNITRTSFLDDFVASLPMLSSDAMFVALGPTPLDALKWCVAQKHLREDQVLGAFAHPATTGGSQVDFYLREKMREDLKPLDPVRNRCDRLDAAYAEMNASVMRRFRIVYEGSAP